MYVCVGVYVPNPFTQAECDIMWIFKVEFYTVNSKFSFLTGCHNKIKVLSLSYYLSIAWERTVRFIPLPRVLPLCEKQTASSNIRTRITASISHYNNRYTTRALKTLTHVKHLIWRLLHGKIHFDDVGFTISICPLGLWP